MSGFYVSLIFFGILLVLFSLVCIFLDKRKVFHFNRDFEDRKRELAEIINDAEQMVEELNRFSDYIVNQMDLKNEELCKNLKDAEEKIGVLGEKARLAAREAAAAKASAPRYSSVSARNIPAILPALSQEAGMECVSEAEPHAAVEISFEAAETAEGMPEKAIPAQIPVIAVNGGISPSSAVSRTVRKNDKVIQINNKYSEVIRLSQEGLYGYEIAKRLNMGKGEVELILGLRK